MLVSLTVEVSVCYRGGLDGGGLDKHIKRLARQQGGVSMGSGIDLRRGHRDLSFLFKTLEAGSAFAVGVRGLLPIVPPKRGAKVVLYNGDDDGDNY